MSRIDMMLAVDVKNLVKVYDGTVKALDGIDLRVGPGMLFALLGPNGAGKTTLIRILTTQLRPSSGEAYVFGFDVAHEDAEVRRIISYVPQEMSVWTDLSGFENLLIYAKIYKLPSKERRAVIREALESMALGEVANHLVRTYSGGMVRRLEMACATLIHPKILFLDEPTIGLDPSARKIVWEKLVSFKRDYGATVFFNTHYMDEADLYSDQIAIINQGKIVKLGTAEELKHSVGGEVILFSLGSNDVGVDILNEVRQLPLVNDLFIGNFELSVITNDAETALPTIAAILSGKGVPVKKISLNKPTLDDVFLKYAGTRLEAGGRISDVRSVRRMIGKG
jgi:ABC-2 type transport system ATP-binding protein